MTDQATTNSALRGGPPAAVLPDLAERLVADARADGVELIGLGGLLGDLTKRVLEAGLEAELCEHLGYDKHAVEGRDGGNSRNGRRPKTVITDVGPVAHSASCPPFLHPRTRVSFVGRLSRGCRLGWRFAR
jgi:hypothetical protein